jgi:hypothetical protein
VKKPVCNDSHRKRDKRCEEEAIVKPLLLRDEVDAGGIRKLPWPNDLRDDDRHSDRRDEYRDLSRKSLH